MKLSRRSFFGFLGGAAVATTVTPSVIVKKTASVGISSEIEAHSAKAIVGKYENQFMVPQALADEIFKRLKENMSIGRLMNGQND